MAPENRRRAPRPRDPGGRRSIRLRVRGRTYRAVLTPDWKVGGYWVRVPELPGCLTEGNTLAEAKRMAADAITLWLKSATPAADRVTRRHS